MDEKDTLEFTLEDIMKEFGSHADEEVSQYPEAEVQEETPETKTAEEPEMQEEPSVEEDAECPPVSVTSETVTADTIRLDLSQLPKGQVKNAQPILEETEDTREPFSDQWEPEYEQPMGEYVPTPQIIAHPRSRLRELKRKLVAGPEKQYYALLEKGFGKLQAAIFLSALVVFISAIATFMHAFGLVQENRLRFLVFGQFLAMLISALLGSYQLIDGVADLLHKRFTLNTLLVFTFLACCVDGALGLYQLRIPCCAAFSLQMTMSLWRTYQKRNTKLGQLDTMRKATHLDCLSAVDDYCGGKKGLLRREGQVEDFMDNYQDTPAPEADLNKYGLIVLCVATGIAITAGVLQGIAVGVLPGISAGIQVLAVSVLVAVPATAFIAVSRPTAVLQRRLHAIGAVICGWKGVEGLSGEVAFPVTNEDIFPAGTTRMNGVKFFGPREPDDVVAYCTAMMVADGHGLAPLFTQVLESRNGRYYDAKDITLYDGGIGGFVEGESVLVGSLNFLRDMEVELPEGIRINQAICIAIEGELAGVFAVNYDVLPSSCAAMRTLLGYPGLTPVLMSCDFNLTERFLQNKLDIKTKRLHLLTPEELAEVSEKTLSEGAPALAVITGEHLLPFAYSATGARTLKSAARTGAIIHMVGGGIGLAIMLTLVILGALHLMTPANMFLYQLVWMIPGFLITEWTRSI